MMNKRDSTRIAVEAILLLIYAWNSCPVLGTDISCSLVAVGREFSSQLTFPQVNMRNYIRRLEQSNRTPRNWLRGYPLVAKLRISSSESIAAGITN